jgi:hypothetical protein
VKGRCSDEVLPLGEAATRGTGASYGRALLRRLVDPAFPASTDDNVCEDAGAILGPPDPVNELLSLGRLCGCEIPLERCSGFLVVRNHVAAVLQLIEQ